MTSGRYSFIDMAVLDGVRARFAAGDALAILSDDLATVLWANGPGAALFGHSDIEAIMGAAAGLGFAARRQVAATPGFPDIGRDKGVVVRLTNGLASRAVAFLASGIVLPGGERAILLAVPAAEPASTDPRAVAQEALAGFSEAGYFAALVDGDAAIAAATGGFAALGIEQEALRTLIDEARGERDRLVKRLIPAGSALYPAGFARLTDDPAQHLLLVVAEDQSAAPPEKPATPEDQPALPLEQDNHRSAPSSPAAVDAAAADRDGARGQIDRWYFGVRDAEEEPAPPAPAEPAQTPAAAPAEPKAAPAEQEVPPAAPEAAPAELQAAPAESQAAPPPPQRPAGPVRFVWRTDAQGRFSAISEDFAAAVGASSADVIGRRFRDVANAFGLDPDGEIAGLLERRDTWSGRSVLWPIAGTDLRAPVDLAALPVYARDRSFEGFRGFGVARVSDAVPDPEALGLALVEVAKQAEEPAPPVEGLSAETTPEPSAASDPFRGEVPALVIDNTPERRFTDKVIRLAEHRHPAVERSLTPVERSAFREIGDRLKKDGTARPAPAEVRDSPVAEAPAAAEAAEVEREEGEAEIAATGLLPQAEEPLGHADDGSDYTEPEAITSEPAAETVDAAAADDGVAEPAAGKAVEPETRAEDGAVEPEAAGEDAATADVIEFIAPAAVEDAGRAPPPPLQAEGFLPAAFPEEAPPSPQVDVSILSRLPVPVLIHSGDRLHYANREFFQITGYESVAVLEAAGGLGALFADPYDADDGAAAEDRRMRLKTLAGEEFPVEALLQSVPWGGGKALLLAIRPIGEPSIESISEPEGGEPASDVEARIGELRTILDTATDGVVLITNDGAIRSISRPAEALFGLDSQDVAGESFTSLFAVESQRAARDYLAGLSDNGVASVLNDGREVIGREAQGRFIPLFMTIGKLPGDSGYCAVLRDITQWKRAEEELTQARAQAERSSSQKTDFLARVSHEIRTPLNAIIGFSELMIDEKFGPVGNDRYRDYLRDINRSGNHVLDLVNDLLDISKIEAGEQEMSYEAVSLNDTLGESVAMLQPQANRERVIIRSSFASRLPEVVADLRSIRQIAINLLSNAIRYTPAGGQVIISTVYEASGDIVMRVRDTGIGMTHAEIEQALKPFKQINALKRGRGDGTGLGLPLTKAMVEANRARFSINSTPGEGTMVEIIFPSTRVLAD